MRTEPQIKKALRDEDAAAYLGIKPSTLWRWAQQGKVARGIRLSPRCTVWRVADLDAFLEQAAQGGAS